MDAGSRSIVIVDDVEEMRVMVRFALSIDDRWRVVAEAANGMEAIEAAEREHPDVVLLDLEMPWMSGAECLPLIKRASPSTTVVIWTVEPEGRRAASAKELGAIAVFDKARIPATLLPEELYALVN
jgi:chemotaxis response regulator CheB